jgi:hypothetical protein
MSVDNESFADRQRLSQRRASYTVSTSVTFRQSVTTFTTIYIHTTTIDGQNVVVTRRLRPYTHRTNQGSSLSHLSVVSHCFRHLTDSIDRLFDTNHATQSLSRYRWLVTVSDTSPTCSSDCPSGQHGQAVLRPPGRFSIQQNEQPNSSQLSQWKLQYLSFRCTAKAGVGLWSPNANFWQRNDIMLNLYVLIKDFLLNLDIYLAKHKNVYLKSY